MHSHSYGIILWEKTRLKETFYIQYFDGGLVLIPESQTGNETDFSTIGAMLGFAVMMSLDVALR